MTPSDVTMAFGACSLIGLVVPVAPQLSKVHCERGSNNKSFPEDLSAAVFHTTLSHSVRDSILCLLVTMLRSGASASAFRALARPLTYPPRPTLPTIVKATQWPSTFSSLSSDKRPQRPQIPQLRPVQAVLFRRTLADKIDKEAEKRYQHEKLVPTPETVTTTSTTRPAFSEVGVAEEPRDIDMMKGVKQDIVCGPIAEPKLQAHAGRCRKP